MTLRKPQVLHPCPCCGCLTIALREDFEVCPVCYWEDDPAQHRDATLRGGANLLSLKEARKNYEESGASDPEFLDLVREPFDHEKPV